MFKNSETKYLVKCYNNDYKEFTAEELYLQVQKDSRYDYNWIASASELVNTVSSKGFPEKYALAIKMLVLNCFANVELKQEHNYYHTSSDEQAVHSCYISIPDNNKKCKRIKEKYLRNIIRAVIKYDRTEERFPIHSGPSYDKFCSEWIEARYYEYSKKETIDFKNLRNELYDDFEKRLAYAEERGDFKEDDKKARKELDDFLNSILLWDDE